MLSALWLLFAGLVVGWLVGFALSAGLLTWLLLFAALAVLVVTINRSRGSRYMPRYWRVRAQTRQ